MAGLVYVFVLNGAIFSYLNKIGELKIFSLFYNKVAAK